MELSVENIDNYHLSDSHATTNCTFLSFFIVLHVKYSTKSVSKPRSVVRIVGIGSSPQNNINATT